MPTERLAVELHLDEDLLDLKLAALHAQRSQTRDQELRVGTGAYRRWWERECFVAPESAR